MFTCIRCGTCCKNLESGGSVREKRNTSPYVDLFEGSFEGLTLFEWEYSELEKSAGKIRVVPLKAIYDLNENISLVLLWGIEGRICHFLRKNQCRVYSKRPLMCRAYPLVHTGLLKEAPFPVTILGCSGTGSLDFRQLREKSIRDANTEMREYFGDELYLSSLQNDLICFESVRHIKDLIDRDMIKPAINFDMESLLEKAHQNPKIGLYEFLVRKGVMTKGDYDDYVEKVRGMVYAKQVFSCFVS